MKRSKMRKLRRKASDFVSRLSKIQNNHRDHKDPGYCTNQNLICRGSQKAEVDPDRDIENKSKHKESGAENEKSRHAEENQNTTAI